MKTFLWVSVHYRDWTRMEGRAVTAKSLHRRVEVPEPYQAGDTTLTATGRLEWGNPDLPSE